MYFQNIDIFKTLDNYQNCIFLDESKNQLLIVESIKWQFNSKCLGNFFFQKQLLSLRVIFYWTFGNRKVCFSLITLSKHFANICKIVFLFGINYCSTSENRQFQITQCSMFRRSEMFALSIVLCLYLQSKQRKNRCFDPLLISTFTSQLWFLVIILGKRSKKKAKK